MPMKKKVEDAGEDAGKVVRGAGAARAQSAIEAQKKRASAVKKKPRVYVVKSGDSLSKIAKEVYGDASRWPEIFEANKEQIKDPNLIRVGQELDIIENP